jgi:hypothetical protein
MPTVTAFYWINETFKPESQRVYHNNSACWQGRDIPASERLAGTNDYRLCADCARLNSQRR